MLSLFRTPPPPLETPEGMAATVAWIERVCAQPEGYRMGTGQPTTLLATCFAVLALEHLGGLDRLSGERRATLVRTLKARQLPDSGLFRDPLHDDAMLSALRKFTPLYVTWQETYFALHALDALGERRDHPLAFVEPLRDRGALAIWLGTLGFDDFWFSSNYLMFLLFFLLEAEGETSPTAHHVLDWLDARQDPDTGYWGTKQGASLFNGMAGAYHLYGFYQYLGRPIHHQDRALAATLSLQEASGLFGEPGGGPCEDVDAIDILVKLKPGSTKREAEVKAALARSLKALRACRRDDGGYCWTSPQRGAAAREVTYSGLPTLRTQSDASDLWSTWFRPLAIALARDGIGEPAAWPLTYRAKPLLGWHQGRAAAK